MQFSPHFHIRSRLIQCICMHEFDDKLTFIMDLFFLTFEFSISLLLERKNVSFSVYFHVVIQFKNCCPQYAFPSYVHHKPSQLSRLISLNCQSLTANAARWRPRILSMLERDRKLGSLSLSRQQPLEVVLFRRADFLSTSNIEKNFPHLHSSSCLYVCKNETREDFKNAHGVRRWSFLINLTIGSLYIYYCSFLKIVFKEFPPTDKQTQLIDFRQQFQITFSSSHHHAAVPVEHPFLEVSSSSFESVLFQ